MKSQEPDPRPTPSQLSSVGEAIAQNQEVAEEIKRAADDLAVVHAVLDTKIADAPADADVQRAVAETLEVEKRLAKSADKLEQVNETLASSVQGGRQASGSKAA